MNAGGKSDGPIVPRKPTNKGDHGGRKPHPARPLAKSAEGRGPAKGNSFQSTGDRTQCRVSLQVALERIRKAVGRDKQMRLTARWHHVHDVARLREAYFGLEPKAAPGWTVKRGRSMGKTWG